MELIGYSLIFLGLIILKYRISDYLTSINIADEYYYAYGHNFRNAGFYATIIPLIYIATGTFIVFGGIYFSPIDRDTQEHLWLLFFTYGLGHGVTEMTAARNRAAWGPQFATDLEWKFADTLNVLYYFFSIWFFIKVMALMPWWIVLVLIFAVATVGSSVSQFFWRRMGVMQGLLFLISPINLIWGTYILWTL